MFILRTLGLTGIVGAIAMHGVLYKQDCDYKKKKYNQKVPIGWMPPDRSHVIQKAKKIKYDMVIIGGGSVGAGCLLDAATRNYSVLLLEKNDFASGTSSKSTKLIHGGIRYLEKAIKELDYRQLSLVVEGLRERKSFLSMSPYLTREVGILLPIKNKFAIPYFWLGTKVYDWLSGMYGIQKSYFIDKKTVQSLYPAINQNKIAGSMVYFDGQMDDSRVNTMLIETGVYYGGDAINYAKVIDLKKHNGKISGVSFIDKETGEKIEVKCKGVINATGPWSDTVREKDSSSVKPIMSPSVGTHLIMESGYTGKFGLLNPSTKNGSVLFLLPWKGASIAGTTDVSTSALKTPIPTKKDIFYIIDQMSEFIDKKIRPKSKNILSAWSGIRPLAKDISCNKKGSEALVRSHLIETSSSGLVTIAGGKWTSFREMAEETITHGAKVFSLPERECVTKYIKLIGSSEYHPNLPTSISREFGIPLDIAKHLVNTYGDRARKVCMYSGGDYSRIHPRYPYIKAEIPYVIKHEHVMKIADFLGRRSLFAYFDVRTAHDSIDTIYEIFLKYTSWSNLRKVQEKQDAYMYLDTMGYSLLKQMEKEEQTYKQFKKELINICDSSYSCNTKKTEKLITRFYGNDEKNNFLSYAKGRESVPLHNIITNVSQNQNLLS